MAGLVSVVDILVYKIASRFNAGFEASFVLIFDWFFFYCATRTYSNSFETVVVSAAFYYWPPINNGNAIHRIRSLVFAALSVIVRPSAGVFWVFLGSRHLLFELRGIPDRLDFTLEVFCIGVVSVALMVCIDYVGYGKVTMVPWNFMKVNILDDVGSEYGLQSWHWYFTQGLPVVIGTWLPSFMVGCRSAWGSTGGKVMVQFVIWGLFILSISGHKELRFVLPLIPMVCVLSGIGLKILSQSNAWMWFRNTSVALNIVVAYYLSRWHQSAPLYVLDFLAAESNVRQVDFLTKCHATPYWSHMHGTSANSMTFLDCSPAISALENVSSMNMQFRTGVEEEDVFFSDPIPFLKTRYRTHTPTHIVISSSQNAALAYLKSAQDYLECASYFQTPYESFVVLCRLKTSSLPVKEL